MKMEEEKLISKDMQKLKRYFYIHSFDVVFTESFADLLRLDSNFYSLADGLINASYL